MASVAIISHGDADGIISVALSLKRLHEKRPLVHFSHPAILRSSIASILAKPSLPTKLYVFDLAANQKTMLLSSVFDSATWIDHHEWEIKSFPSNVEVVVDKDSPSAAALVAKYFEVEDELVGWANEIDRDSIESSEAEFLRNLVASYKWKYKGAMLHNKLVSLAKTLALEGLEVFEKDLKVVKLIDDYLKWVEKRMEEVISRTKVFTVAGNKKLAVYETTKPLPMYLVVKKLKEHEAAPFHVIAGVFRQIDRTKKRIYTKVELRTHTQENVYRIAKSLGGGGHEVAAAATIQEFLPIPKLVESVDKLFPSSKA